MNEHELSEIDLRQGETRVRIRRGGEVVVSGAPVRTEYAPVAAAPAPAPAAAPVKPAEPQTDEYTVFVKSPMVGTFYSAPDPESPSFVKVGDHIGPETTVCIVEAMKVFNQIPAEVSGKIVAMLVENGQPVEFGQSLFKVDTRP
jgi:acetyl-CoA carboxylase biotin carboxyl carrier protein